MPLSLRAVEATPKPVASNLDTLASIYAAIGLRQRDKGDTAGAVRNFKLAAERYGQVSALAPAGGEPMSRQAQMLELAGDQEAAANCYDQMLNLEGLRPELLPAVRNNLAMCLIRLDRTPADRERAVTLATEATRLAPDQPAYLDTLGWCQLKAEHLPEAAASFRKAQAKSAGGKPLPSAAIGLATVLAQGTPQEQAQAKTILDGIDPKSLDAEDAARYHRAVELRTTPR